MDYKLVLYETAEDASRGFELEVEYMKAHKEEIPYIDGEQVCDSSRCCGCSKPERFQLRIYHSSLVDRLEEEGLEFRVLGEGEVSKYAAPSGKEKFYSLAERYGLL